MKNTLKSIDVKIIWDEEAEVYVAVGDKIGLVLESESYDRLLERVRIASPEMMADMEMERQASQPQGPQKKDSVGTAEERAAANVKSGDNSQAAKARVRAANMTAPR